MKLADALDSVTLHLWHPAVATDVVNDKGVVSGTQVMLVTVTVEVQMAVAVTVTVSVMAGSAEQDPHPLAVRVTLKHFAWPKFGLA